MLTLQKETRIYIRPGKTDFRKSINGLCVLVQEHMQGNPFSGNYYVFCNRTKTMLKILYWDRNGFCLWHKRLEEDRFRWPRTPEEVHEITREEFHWLLHGLDFYNAHKNRRYSRVV
jgi:transposase